LVRVEVQRRPGQSGTVIALCLEVHDLVLAKCAAGRERDWEFAEIGLRAEIVELRRLLDAVEDMPLDPAGREHVRAMLNGIRARGERLD
jgi:hypothetical protein